MAFRRDRDHALGSPGLWWALAALLSGLPHCQMTDAQAHAIGKGIDDELKRSDERIEREDRETIRGIREKAGDFDQSRQWSDDAWAQLQGAIELNDVDRAKRYWNGASVKPARLVALLDIATAAELEHPNSRCRQDAVEFLLSRGAVADAPSIASAALAGCDGVVRALVARAGAETLPAAFDRSLITLDRWAERLSRARIDAASVAIRFLASEMDLRCKTKRCNSCCSVAETAVQRLVEVASRAQDRALVGSAQATEAQAGIPRDGDSLRAVRPDGRRTILIEAETAPAVISGGRAFPQRMKGVFNGWWSGGAQLFWRDGRPGDHLDLAFDVVAPGDCEVYIAATKAPDYGIFAHALDGRVLGDPIDLYERSVKPSGLIHLGSARLTEGRHELRATIQSTNLASASAYFDYGLDALLLACAQ